ncbi:hypothetical protein BHM03_00010084 [Ensete ventricosum]|nr:hypothetical protein BHM03_00010084 [Ensete ventricosum]
MENQCRRTNVAEFDGVASGCSHLMLYDGRKMQRKVERRERHMRAKTCSHDAKVVLWRLPCGARLSAIGVGVSATWRRRVYHVEPR